MDHAPHSRLRARRDHSAPPLHRPRRIAALVAVLTVCACGSAEEPMIPVACTETTPTTRPTVAATDTLDLFVVLDSVPSGAGSVRLRVDGLAQPGIVNFFLPPPTAAAAGMALQPPETFAGCAATAPAGLELRAPRAPRGKAWVRVSTDRPVRVHPLAAGRRAAPAVVSPGESAIVGWDA